MSGVTVSNEVKAIIEEMRVNKSTDDPAQRVRLVILAVQTEIVVEKIYRQEDLNGESPFKVLMDRMTGDLKDKCRYFLYDCHYGTDECSHKEDLAYIMWGPCDATISCRMRITSSARAIEKILSGFKHKLQINDLDFDRDSFIHDNLGPNVISFEEEDCHCHNDH